MKILEDSFKKNFVKEITYYDKTAREYRKKTVHDGEKFEELVLDLLKLLYSDIKLWNSTKKTHDGSRDFHAQSLDKLLWAECKNYNNNISITTIANTLIMAQICNVDELLFFSFSPINNNTKKKLCYYAYINKKMIKFFDDYVLENLILSQTTILNKYFKESGLKCTSKEFDCDIFYWFIKNPFLNLYKGDYEFGIEISDLKYNDVYTLDYAIINNSIDKPLEILFTYNPMHKDNDYFALLDINEFQVENNQLCIRKKLKPNEMYFQSFAFKLIKYKSKLKIPVISLFHKVDDKVEVYPSIDKEVTCTWIGKAKLVGSQYEYILSLIENEVLNYDYLSGMLIHGSSGTGKTRLIEESIGILLKNKYKILNFIGIENDSGINVIKEIVNVLYELTDEIINMSNIEEIIPRDLIHTTEAEQAIDLLKILSKQSAVEDGKLNGYYKIIFERLAKEKYVIIIDNLQYFDNFMIGFLEELLKFSKNNNRKNLLSLILVINTDYTEKNSLCMKIKNIIEQLNSSCCCKFYSKFVDGFNNSQISLNFLKQILRLKDEQYDNHLLKLLNRLSLKPYFIEQSIIELFNLNILQFVDENLYITDPEIFIRNLEELPEEINKTIERRWNYLQEKHQHYIEDFKKILSIIHLCQKIDSLFLIKSDINNESIDLLVKYHIIKKEESANIYYYLYDHDLIESYFQNYYIDLYQIGIDYLYANYLDDIKVSYPVIYNICCISCNDLSLLDLENILNNGFKYGVSYKIYYFYYEVFLNKYMQVVPQGNEIKHWLNNINKICSNMRDRLGNKQVEYFFEKIYKNISLNDQFITLAFSAYSSLIFTLSETAEHLGHANVVIQRHNEHLQFYRRHLKNNRNIEIMEAVTFIHNRLHIAYKKSDRDDSYRMQKNHLRTSIRLSKKLDNKQFLAENLFDKGNLYYDYNFHSEKVVKYWQHGCDLVDENNIELMTLHQIKKRIQICLIVGKLQRIPSLLKRGFSYLEHGKYNEYSLFFSSFFHLAKGLYLLMIGELNYEKVINELNLAEQDYLLFGRERGDVIGFLKGKLAARYKKTAQAYQFYFNAFQKSKENNMRLATNRANFKVLIEDMINNLRLLDEDFELNFMQNFTLDEIPYQYQDLIKMNKQDFENYYFNYKTDAIINAQDRKEGYPAI